VEPAAVDDGTAASLPNTDGANVKPMAGADAPGRGFRKKQGTRAKHQDANKRRNNAEECSCHLAAGQGRGWTAGT
jgi:hypothetical protein